MRVPPRVAQPSPRTVTSSEVRPIRRFSNCGIASLLQLRPRSPIIADAYSKATYSGWTSSNPSSPGLTRGSTGFLSWMAGSSPAMTNKRRFSQSRIAQCALMQPWAVAFAALAIYSVSFGAPYITVVALKPIAAELGSARSVPALAFALAWFGSAVGGIAMGWLAERLGIRWTVIGGALMVALGLVLSSLGGQTTLLIGHGLFIGLLGNAGINAPLYVYVSRWFDRRRGSAMALISS